MLFFFFFFFFCFWLFYGGLFERCTCQIIEGSGRIEKESGIGEVPGVAWKLMGIGTRIRCSDSIDGGFPL